MNPHPPKKGHFATSIITTLEKTLFDYSTGGCSYLEMMVSLIYALQTFSQDNNYVLLIYQTKWKKICTNVEPLVLLFLSDLCCFKLRV